MFTMFSPIPLSVEIMVEIETNNAASGGRAVFQTTMLFNGVILLMTDAQKLESVRAYLARITAPPTDKLLAIHIPETQWRRIPIDPT